MRERRSRRGGILERKPVLLVGENVLDRPQAIGAESFRPITGGLEPIGPVEPAEAHQPEARAVALFGMRTALQDARSEPTGRRAGVFRPGDQARRCPFGVRPMRVRHVGGLRGEPAPAREARVRRDTVALQEDFHRPVRESGLDAGVDELIRHAVEVVIDLHVVIDVHAARLPGRQLVACARERPEGGPIDLLEEGAPTDPETLHRPRVDRVDARVDGGIEVGEGEEGLMPEGGQDPSLGDLDTHLDLRLVRRRRHPGGDHHGAVMRRQFCVGPVDLGFVAMRGRDAALQVVGLLCPTLICGRARVGDTPDADAVVIGAT